MFESKIQVSHTLPDTRDFKESSFWNSEGTEISVSLLHPTESLAIHEGWQEARVTGFQFCLRKSQQEAPTRPALCSHVLRSHNRALGHNMQCCTLDE